MQSVLGWDIGGANVKAVRVRADRPAPERVVERPFRVWEAPEELPAVLGEVRRELEERAADPAASVMAVTMTAELADCFPTKREGVFAVLAACDVALGPDIRVFGLDGRFHSPAGARRDPLNVAAANWLAAAACAARGWPDSLLLDVGGSTTDIVPVVDGRVAALGGDDTARLASGELVYTGLLRTPVMALVRRVPLRPGQCPVAAEHFAIAADAHLWLGRIDPGGYTCETPDGGGRTRADAGRRLARMVCGDPDTVPAEDVTAIARAVVAAQRRQIGTGVRSVRRRLGAAAPSLALLAGSGRRLAAEVADGCGLTPVPLATAWGEDGARVAPATAVAQLLAEEMAARRGGGRHGGGRSGWRASTGGRES